jgi:CheY-like chemotaxis protein
MRLAAAAAEITFSTNKAAPIMRALVVDDSAVIVEIISNTLRKAGFEVASAANGEDGFAAFQLGDFDIVLTDITMPECDGIEMTDS